jgi:hypothetical protein
MLGLLHRQSKEGDSHFPARAKAEIVRLAKDEFARAVDERNQYYGFTDEQKDRAGAIYGILSDEIAEAIAGPGVSAIPLEERILEHRRRLREIFAEPVEEKPCHYYEAALQLALFSIDADSLDEPILDSLKKGGTFYYAPSLPFVERHLDPGRYALAARGIKPGLGVSAVTRL